MKKILLFTASLVVAASAFAQGTVQFNNIVTASQLRFPIYDVEVGNPIAEKHGNTSTGQPAGAQTYSGALLAGTGYTVELWGIVGSLATNTPATSNALTRLAGTSFRTGTAAGFINTALLPGGAPGVAVPGAPLGGAPANGTFQIRAWNNVGGTIANWANALALPAVARGASEIVNAGPLGGTGSPAATDPALNGMTSFNLHIVPEPSAIALGVLGLGTLMFLRRRK
jgi:hypothetical protein